MCIEINLNKNKNKSSNEGKSRKIMKNYLICFVLYYFEKSELKNDEISEQFVNSDNRNNKLLNSLD